jgi:chromosome segregation ATPase
MMKWIYPLVVLVLSLGLYHAPCMAQEDDIAHATSSLQSVLSNLQQSVQQLSVNNDQLSARDDFMKVQISKLQLQLGDLQSQGNSLGQAVGKLQADDPGRDQKISDLEEENRDLDNRIEKAQDGIRSIQRSLGEAYQDDQNLLLKLKGTSGELPSSIQGSENPADIHQEKEKLKLMKMIYDSQQRQEDLHGSLLEFQKNTSLLPAASALAHQQLLKEQIKDLEAQTAVYSQEKFSANGGAANQWDERQLHQLEGELKVLEQNYGQLKDLMVQMGQKAQNSGMTLSQHVEEGKLQSSIDDQNHQEVSLRADLDDLRSQMIDLDKRKSRLETMVQ